MYNAFTDRVNELQATRGMSAADARADAMRRFGELRSRRGEPFGVQRVITMMSAGKLWADGAMDA